MYSRDLELFIDMDNTVVNFDKHVIDIMNEEKGMNYDYKDNKCWWWSDTGVEKSYFEEVVTRQGIFLNCKPIEGAVEYINQLHKEGYKIVFLTLPQWNNMYCVIEKIDWLKRHFEWFDENEHIVLTKQKHLLYKPFRVIIDDSVDYLYKWNGISICKATQINEEYKGLRCETWEEIYELINKMERGEWDESYMYR